MTRPKYRFNITWQYLADIDPERKHYEYGVVAVNVQRVIAKLLGDLTEAGYDRKDIRVIDVQNMDIT